MLLGQVGAVPWEGTGEGFRGVVVVEAMLVAIGVVAVGLGEVCQHGGVVGEVVVEEQTAHFVCGIWNWVVDRRVKYCGGRKCVEGSVRQIGAVGGRGTVVKEAKRRATDKIYVDIYQIFITIDATGFSDEVWSMSAPLLPTVEHRSDESGHI